MNRIHALLLSLALASCASPGATASPRNDPSEIAPDVPNVGIVVFDGLFITELVAPFDVYKHAGDRLNVFTVAESRAPYRSYYGLGLVPDFTFEDCPEIDVLVVPSGSGSLEADLENERLIAFVRERAREASWVTSHCWGAFTLARAGVLDGREATTFPGYVERLQAASPRVLARAGRRFVVDGNVVTSGGGLAAFEAAVWVVGRVCGEDVAGEVADGLVFAPENRRHALADAREEARP